MTWEECVDEISKTVLIAAKEHGDLNSLEIQHIIKMSERAVKEAQDDKHLGEYDLS